MTMTKGSSVVITTNDLSKLTGIMTEIQNPLATGFATILVTETGYSEELITKFFEYWDNFTNGEWDGYMLFSHDGVDDDITTGICFNEDNILDRLNDFINDIVPIQLEQDNLLIESLRNQLTCSANTIETLQAELISAKKKHSDLCEDLDIRDN